MMAMAEIDSPYAFDNTEAAAGNYGPNDPRHNQQQTTYDFNTSF